MIDVREEIPERPIHILITWFISDLYPGLLVGFTIQSWGCGRSTKALLCSDVYIFVHFCAWSDRNLVILLNLRLNVQIYADISTAI